MDDIDMKTDQTFAEVGALDSARRFPYQLSYVWSASYPNPKAEATQSIQMAAGFSRLADNVDFYVQRLRQPEKAIRKLYPGVSESPLVIHSLRMMRVPSRLSVFGMAHRAFNTQIVLRLLMHQRLRRISSDRHILYIRNRRELLFWGRIRPYVSALKKWIFIFEADDAAGLEPEDITDENPFDLETGRNGRRAQKILRSLRNFDIIVCVTRALADDLNSWTNGALQPHVVRHAAGIHRLSLPPTLRLFGDRIVLGYIGTIDRFRGVDQLVKAMKLLPNNYVLRLVGRVSQVKHYGGGNKWLEDLLDETNMGERIELVQPFPQVKVAEEIDRCDIVLQPASSHIFTLRYASPLKSFDYMVRGKPIVAADVPCHRELLTDGVNARLYRPGDVVHLAECIRSLVDEPRQAAAIAREAWQGSADFNYDSRAEQILGLVESGKK